ncbi:partial Intermembrane transport protein YebS, partial [Gammaproteobacteria bacterium]
MPRPTALAQAHLVACHDCALVFPKPQARKGERAVCPRCGAELFEHKGHSLDHTLALALTSFILFVMANINTLLVMKIGGQTQAGAIITGVRELFAEGYWAIAALVFVVSILAPLLKLLCLFYTLVPLRLGFRLPHATRIFRFYEVLHPWSMTEVYMLGILVAVVKLADLASIEPGIALYSFAALIFFMAATDASMDDHGIWESIGESPRPTQPARLAQGVFLLCHTCHLLSRSASAHPHCPRCGAVLHQRKPDSLARTWALTLTAYILYIPANLLPIMSVTMSGRGEPDTILSGVKELIVGGMWPLALLVFFASITVPVLKLLALTYLLLSVQFKSNWRPRERTVLYRITESVGRWSMLDIFVIAI